MRHHIGRSVLGGAMMTFAIGICICLQVAGVTVEGDSRQWVGRSEVKDLRDANTRVWENSYETTVVDPLTHLPSGEKKIVQERHFEKATNLCYQAVISGVTQWVPSSPAFSRAEEEPPL